MRERKKKLLFAQIILLLSGIFIIMFTYVNRDKDQNSLIISKDDQKKIKDKLINESEGGNVFYDIEYSGIDLAGNRYILKSEEAFNIESNQEIINMKFVQAIFYFKDDTILYVWSDKGLYNNRTLDMKFDGNVRVNYGESELFAQKAEYSNLNSYISITDDVSINDIRGTMVADRILFVIKKKTLNIESFNENKVNANVKMK